MHIFYVDLSVVFYVDTEWVIWDFDTKIREKSCLGLALGLDNKVLFTSLVFRIPSKCILSF